MSWKVFRVALLAVGLTVLYRQAAAQTNFREQFQGHNASMAALQPAFLTPLVGADPRLVQYAKASFSHEYLSNHTMTMNYGNARGAGLIAGTRLEFDFVPPPYLQHNSAASDGFGDMSMLVKYRIASGNAQHGNFVVSAVLAHCFATGSHKNGASTDSYGPTLAAGYGIKKFDVLSSLVGTLPTGKIAVQGRSIGWNTAGQLHATRAVWLAVENNATFYFAGSHDGKVQNFVTPAGFYVLRKKEWKKTHPFWILDGGMQIAISDFHTYNHNLIAETRILF